MTKPDVPPQQAAPQQEAGPALSPREEQKAKLVMETAQVSWLELQRFYARGQVVRVAAELDLIEAALAVSDDDKARVQSWLEQNLFGEVAPSQARTWFDQGANLWTVVVAPWVLVQEPVAEPAGSTNSETP